MEKKVRKASVSDSVVAKVEPIRANYKLLLASNPNYFGNLENTDLKPVEKMTSNTNYEELMCVGLYPEFDTLEAVVYVKKESGYSGGICSDGSLEYVRFYLTWDNGKTWHDQGLTSFRAHDIKGKKPLEYAVALKINPKKRPCKYENLPKVRAILSWNVAPPPNDPNYTPVWGNVMDKYVQIDILKLLIFKPFPDIIKYPGLIEVLKANNLVSPTATEAEISKMDMDALKKDVIEAIEAGEEKEISPARLKEIYKKDKVSEDRFLYPAIQKMAKKPIISLKNSKLLNKTDYLSKLDINISDVIGNIIKTDGNTNFEEMGCIGLNVETSWLEATITVKKPSGYNGGLCYKGSREYVAFWMDFGSGWQYVGTGSVKVHDISSIPKEGLQYALYVPVDLTKYRKPCTDGPVTAKVRAILSWETPPPPANYNWTPTWGNREETTVFIAPGQPVPGNTHPPFIETVGGMSVSDINNATGLADGAAVTAGFHASDSPFAGQIVLTGHLANPTDISNPAAQQLKYQVQVSNDGGVNWQTLTNTFTVQRTQLLNGVWSNLPSKTQAVDADGYYEYLEDFTGNKQTFVKGNVLARWYTGSGMNGHWLIRINSKDEIGGAWTSNIIRVALDNTAPTIGLTMTSGSGACSDVHVGGTVSGAFTALDDYFYRYRLSVSPDDVAGTPIETGVFTVNPSAGGSETEHEPLNRYYSDIGVPDTGEIGTWEWDTTGMQQCGYVVSITVWDRAIINSGSACTRYRTESVGLCLRE